MSFHDQQYNEKRDFIRMQVETPARLRITGLSEELQVLCLDLSSSGAQLRSPQALAIGSTVELLIPSPTAGHQGLQASGKVVRCQTAEPGSHLLGLTFDSVS